MDYHGGDDMRLFGAFFLWRQYAEAGMAAAFIDDVYGRSFFCRVVSKPLFSEKQAGPLRKIPVLPNFFSYARKEGVRTPMTVSLLTVGISFA